MSADFRIRTQEGEYDIEAQPKRPFSDQLNGLGPLPLRAQGR
jgi:hypothetical protein